MERTRIKYYLDKDGLYKSNVWFKYYRKNDDKFIDCQVVFDKESYNWEIVTRTKTCLASSKVEVGNYKVMLRHIRAALEKLGIKLITAEMKKEKIVTT